MPNTGHTALRHDSWEEDHLKDGILIVLSSEEDLQKLENEMIQSNISVSKIPRLWTIKDGQSNMRTKS